MSFEETDVLARTPHGSGWRKVSGVTARAFVAETWMDLPVTDVNDESKEVRVEFEVDGRHRPFILGPAEYTLSSGSAD